MKKFTFSLSFILAVVVHIIVLVLSGIFIGDKQISFEYQNAIPVQFGNGGVTRSGAFGASAEKSHSQSKSDSLPDRTKETSIPSETNSLALKSSTSITASTQNNTESSPGNPNGTTFESTILSYNGPTYPRIAQVRGLEGTVKLSIVVTPEGRSQTATIIKSSGHDILDQAAIGVVPSWRFRPSDTNYTVEKNIVFQLKN